jgi:hypothetical protein
MDFKQSTISNVLKNNNPVEYALINMRCKNIVTGKYLRDNKAVIKIA